jgi:hypothetical protein
VVVLIAIMAPLMELQHLSPHMISTCIVEWNIILRVIMQ